MNFKFIKIEDKYVFYKNNKEFLTPSGNLLYVHKKIHAQLVLKELVSKKKNQSANSILNLTLFSCNLNTSETNQIKKKISENLEYDCILYRSSDESELIKKMNTELNCYISNFEIEFQTKLEIVDSFFKKKLDIGNNFKEYLDKLNNFDLTVFFKISSLTKSSILTYFFIKKKINYYTLYKLTNIEYTYQQTRWGLVDEQKKIDKNNIDELKNISFFFKKIN